MSRWSELRATVGSENFMKCMTFVGLVISNLPNGFPVFFGNLLTYVESYQRERQSLKQAIDPSISSCAYLLFWIPGIGCGKYLSKYLGKRGALLAGMVLYDLSFAISYWVVQHSTTILIAVLGVMGGFGSGCMSSLCFQYLLDWSKGKNFGVGSAITTTTSFGGVAINEIITIYINPDNLATNVRTKKTTYFGQPEIVDRVPYCFLVLAGVFFLTHMLSLCLIKNPTSDAKMIEARVTSEDSESAGLLASSCGHENNINKVIHPEDIDDRIDDDLRSYKVLGDLVHDDNCSSNEDSVKPHIKYSKLLRTEQLRDVRDQANGYSSLNSEMKRRELYAYKCEDIPECCDIEPKELFRQPAFYCLCVCLICSEMSYITQATFYKSFGLSVIADDVFLSLLGTTSAVFAFLARLLWGGIVDKWGVKVSLMLMFSSSTVILNFWYFTPRVHRWLFFVWTCLYGQVASGMYGVISAGVYQLFGKEHFTTNYSMVTMGSIISTVTYPFISVVLIEHFGWFLFFTFMAIVQLIGLFTSMFVSKQSRIISCYSS